MKTILSKERKILLGYRDFHICGVLDNEFSESFMNGFNRDTAKYLYRTPGIELSLEDNAWGRYFIVIYSDNMQTLLASDNMSNELLENLKEYCSQPIITRKTFMPINKNVEVEEFIGSILEKKKIIGL
jgi:hypothetical protein